MLCRNLEGGIDKAYACVLIVLCPVAKKIIIYFDVCHSRAPSSAHCRRRDNRMER
jgi:hypothetical protein